MIMCCLCVCFFFFKQKTAYEMRISDWSSDVCSSDLGAQDAQHHPRRLGKPRSRPEIIGEIGPRLGHRECRADTGRGDEGAERIREPPVRRRADPFEPAAEVIGRPEVAHGVAGPVLPLQRRRGRSEEPTSELQSLMRNSYAVF